MGDGRSSGREGRGDPPGPFPMGTASVSCVARDRRPKHKRRSRSRLRESACAFDLRVIARPSRVTPDQEPLFAASQKLRLRDARRKSPGPPVGSISHAAPTRESTGAPSGSSSRAGSSVSGARRDGYRWLERAKLVNRHVVRSGRPAAVMARVTAGRRCASVTTFFPADP